MINVAHVYTFEEDRLLFWLDLWSLDIEVAAALLCKIFRLKFLKNQSFSAHFVLSFKKFSRPRMDAVQQLGYNIFLDDPLFR